MKYLIAFLLLSSIAWAQYIGNGPPPTSCIGAGQPFYVDQAAKPPVLYFPSNLAAPSSSASLSCKWVAFQSGNGTQGPPGAAGKDGTNGIDGKDGADGQPGNDGLDGKDGLNGATGKDGNPGAAGPPGPATDFTQLSSLCAGSSCPPAIAGALVLPITGVPATSTSTTCTFVVHLVAGIPTRYMSCLGNQETPF